MLRVQFNDKKSMQQAEFEQISPAVVQLTGENIQKSEAGFKVYRLNGDLLGDYSDFTEIVGEVDGGFQFGMPEK